MKNKKTLIFLTQGFPYGTTRETFIEHEINHLAQAFDEIHICAASTDERDFFVRPIPANCFAHRILVHQTVIDKIACIFRLLFSFRFYKELSIMLFSYRLRPNIARLKLLFNVDLQAYLIAKQIKKTLPNLESPTLYAYWLNELAYSTVLLKVHYRSSNFIARAHGYDLYFYRNSNNYLPFKSYLASKLSTIYFISKNGKQYLETKVGKNHSAQFEISRLGITNSARKIASQPLSYQVVSCSYILKNKRLPLIAYALQSFNIPLFWNHLGDEENNPDSPEIIAEVAETFLHDVSKYCFHGQKTNSEIFNFYETANLDFFINVSAAEGVPVSIMEAMSFGIPVIATAVGGTPEIVKDAYNGYLLSANPKIEEITGCFAMFYALSDDDRLQMRQNAYNTWNEHFNADKNYRQFAKKI